MGFTRSVLSITYIITTCYKLILKISLETFNHFGASFSKIINLELQISTFCVTNHFGDPKAVLFSSTEIIGENQQLETLVFITQAIIIEELLQRNLDSWRT